jgi:hypothetical protein
MAKDDVKSGIMELCIESILKLDRACKYALVVL